MVQPREARHDRIERRRSEILSAAAETFVVTGYHETTMQAIAAAAGISVGLIYQYFPGKEELLLAVIVDVLERFSNQVPLAMSQAPANPEAQLKAGFAAFCRVIDEHRAATLLAYRESQTLSKAGRAQLMRLETATTNLLTDALTSGIRAGQFRRVSAHLIAHDLKLIAHGWALKHWDLAPQVTLDDYIKAQMAFVLAGLRRPPG